MGSCVPRKKLIYSRQTKKDIELNEYVNIRTQKTIQPFDNLYVKVNSIDEKTQKVFSESANALGTNVDLVSYTVSQSGYINFPFVGEIYVKDLTLLEAQDAIERLVSEYLNNISISVKFINNTVSVVGEVKTPGVHKFYTDQLTIFQALSLAGDISDYGDKTNVTLVRETNNKIHYHYLDLTAKNVVESPHYYIIPNDVIIVKPIRAKFRNLSLVNIPVFLTTITTAATLYLIFNNQ
jgi:polysaccharide export outer membrane protein